MVEYMAELVVEDVVGHGVGGFLPQVGHTLKVPGTVPARLEHTSTYLLYGVYCTELTPTVPTIKFFFRY